MKNLNRKIRTRELVCLLMEAIIICFDTEILCLVSGEYKYMNVNSYTCEYTYSYTYKNTYTETSESKSPIINNNIKFSYWITKQNPTPYYV